MKYRVCSPSYKTKPYPSDIAIELAMATKGTWLEEENPLVDALKDQNNYMLQVVRADRWMVHDGEDFVVYEFLPQDKAPTLIIETPDEGAAVRALLGRIKGAQP